LPEYIQEIKLKKQTYNTVNITRDSITIKKIKQSIDRNCALKSVDISLNWENQNT